MDWGFTLNFLILSILIHYFGFLYGVLLMYLKGLVLNFVLDKLFGLKSIETVSRVFAFLSKEFPESTFIMTGYLLMSDYKPEEWKKIIIERGISRFPKLRQVLTTFLGDFYWKSIENETVAHNQVKIMKNIRFNSVQDICDYSAVQQQTGYEFGTLPYEFHLIPYGDSEGVIFLKFDHYLSDGISFLGFFMALSDNYTIDLFPKLIEPSVFLKLLIWLLNPFYAILNIINIQKLKPKNSPFKRESPTRGKRDIYLAVPLDFAKVNNVCKYLHLTFNDYITCVLSKCFKSYTSSLKSKHSVDYHLNTMTLSSPVSLKSMPKKLEDFVIENNLALHIYEVPLIDDINKEKQKVQEVLSYYLKNIFYSFGSKASQNLLKILPSTIYKTGLDQNRKLTDMIVSNVPGPKSALFYAGSKVKSLMATPQPGFASNNLTIMSYNGEFMIGMASDDKVNINVKDFVNMIVEEIDSDLTK